MDNFAETELEIFELDTVNGGAGCALNPPEADPEVG